MRFESSAKVFLRGGNLTLGAISGSAKRARGSGPSYRGTQGALEIARRATIALYGSVYFDLTKKEVCATLGISVDSLTALLEGRRCVKRAIDIVETMEAWPRRG
jgi:hypothetical protein